MEGEECGDFGVEEIVLLLFFMICFVLGVLRVFLIYIVDEGGVYKGEICYWILFSLCECVCVLRFFY